MDPLKSQVLKSENLEFIGWFGMIFATSENQGQQEHEKNRECNTLK